VSENVFGMVSASQRGTILGFMSAWLNNSLQTVKRKTTFTLTKQIFFAQLFTGSITVKFSCEICEKKGSVMEMEDR